MPACRGTDTVCIAIVTIGSWSRPQRGRRRQSELTQLMCACIPSTLVLPVVRGEQPLQVTFMLLLRHTMVLWRSATVRPVPVPSVRPVTSDGDTTGAVHARRHGSGVHERSSLHRGRHGYATLPEGLSHVVCPERVL